MRSKIALIIALSCLLSGCITINHQKVDWPTPVTPIEKRVEFSELGNGLFLTVEDSSNLLENMEDRDVYIMKLEELVRTMKMFYNAK